MADSKESLADVLNELEASCGCEKTPALDSALDEAADVFADAFRLAAKFERVLRTEDQFLGSQLEPINQKLGALMREIERLRQATQRVRHIQREIEEFVPQARTIVAGDPSTQMS